VESTLKHTPRELGIDWDFNKIGYFQLVHVVGFPLIIQAPRITTVHPN